eukprot:9565123-Ditylum_brightwellii.AAC.1
MESLIFLTEEETNQSRQGFVPTEAYNNHINRISSNYWYCRSKTRERYNHIGCTKCVSANANAFRKDRVLVDTLVDIYPG